MATTLIDARGMKCPQPILRLTTTALRMHEGDLVELVSDCDTFSQDVREWCQRNHKAVLWSRPEGTALRCQIQL